MQTWWEFLAEDYEMTEEQYNALSPYEQFNINREWECYMRHYDKDYAWDDYGKEYWNE